MDQALALAEAGLGRVWPNPSVGCVIVREGTVVGRGATQPGGRPHAEVVALAEAAERAQGATAYVSLEPCAHYGKTPPCANALIAAGVTGCVVALVDPDPRVDGKGLAKLRAAGVHVELGPGEQRARTINEGFFLRVRAGRPLVTVARAEDEDAFMAHDARLRSELDGSGIWAQV
ncbi:MAG: bifunctional diaminohydroxyphosphoribosylaminopyrimidine deaminase/5-amino-6-(5-phosphoribosylamino)uracil reductase RibD, partial [Myxococcota bacterium]